MTTNEAAIIIAELDKQNQDFLSRWTPENIVAFLDIVAQHYPLRDLAAQTLAGEWRPPVPPEQDPTVKQLLEHAKTAGKGKPGQQQHQTQTQGKGAPGVPPLTNNPAQHTP